MLPKKGYYIPRLREMDMVPSVWNNFSECGLGTEKWHGVRIKFYKVFFQNRTHIGIFKELEWNLTGQHLLKRFIKNPGYFNKIWRANEKTGKKTINLSRKIIGSLKHAHLYKALEALTLLKKLWIAYDQINVLPWFFGAEPLRNHLKYELSEKYKIGPEDSEILFRPNMPSLAAQEEVAVYNAAIKYLKTGAAAVTAKKISQNFGWMPFGYDGPNYWDKNYYERKIEKIAKIRPELLRQKIKLLTGGFQKLLRQQNRLIAHYKLNSTIKRLLDIEQKLYILTDERKKVHSNINHAYHAALKILQKPSELALHDLKYLDAEEIIRMFKTKTFKKCGTLSAIRQKSVVCCYTAGGKKEVIITGKHAGKMLEKFTYQTSQKNEVTGMVANRVGTGIIRGVVKKIVNPREMSKMKKGQILVTWMTTPDFVPAMRKAKAIITDEGGITSHAAIVSRELGIPCIIGTKIATKVFKDGDVVEVDTNKGEVKKV